MTIMMNLMVVVTIKMMMKTMTLMIMPTMMTTLTIKVNEGVDGGNPLTQPVLPPSCLNPLAAAAAAGDDADAAECWW